MKESENGMKKGKKKYLHLQRKSIMKSVLTLILVLVMTLGQFGGVPQVEARTGNEKLKVACIGDSITWGIGLDWGGVPETGESYPKYMGMVMGDNYQVENFGASGYAMRKNHPYPYWNHSEFGRAKEWQPDIVLIMLGTNDADAIKSNRALIDEFKADYKDMIAEFEKLDSKPKVYVVTTPVPANGNEGIIADLIVPAEKEVAQDMECDVIDVHAFTSGLTDYLSDAAHFNTYGYARLGEFVSNRIFSDFETDLKNKHVIIKDQSRNKRDSEITDMAYIVPDQSSPFKYSMKGGFPVADYDGKINQALSGNSKFTIDFWVYPNDLMTENTFVMKGNNQVSIKLTDKTLEFCIYNNGWNVAEATYAYNNGEKGLRIRTWNHVAASYDGAVMRLYVNGEEVAHKDVNTTINSTNTPLGLGKNCEGNDAKRLLRGKMASLHIYNRALGAEEIRTEYNEQKNGGAGIQPDSDEVVLYYNASQYELSNEPIEVPEIQSPAETQTPSEAGIEDGMTYTIISASNNKAMTDTNMRGYANWDERGSVEAECLVWNTNVLTDLARWTMVESGDYYTLKNVGSGKVISTIGESNTGDRLDLKGTDNSDKGKWKLVPVTTGQYANKNYYYIVSAKKRNDGREMYAELTNDLDTKTSYEADYLLNVNDDNNTVRRFHAAYDAYIANTDEWNRDGLKVKLAEFSQNNPRQIWKIEQSSPTDENFTFDMSKTMMNSYKDYYFKENGKTGKSLGDGFWGIAEVIESMLDGYELTGLSDYREMAQGTWKEFLYNNKEYWNWNDYNDDVAWASMAAVRSYMLFGDENDLTIAENNFNMMYDRASTITFNGSPNGMLRWCEENGRNVSSHACINGPAACCACYLGDATGDNSYFEKAKKIYLAQRESNLYVIDGENAGAVYDNVRADGNADGEPGSLGANWVFTYNVGTYLGSAVMLYNHYKDDPNAQDDVAKFKKDADTMMNYILKNMCNDGVLKNDESNYGDGSLFRGIMVRYMRKYILEMDEDQYLSFFKKNASVVWMNRNSKNLSHCPWELKSVEDVSWDSSAASNPMCVVTNMPTYADSINRNAYEKIEAEDMDYTKGLVSRDDGDASAGRKIADIRDGFYTAYYNTNFGEKGAQVINLRYSKFDENASSVEFRLDSPKGELLAETNLENTGSWDTWKEITLKMEKTITGKHNIYVVFRAENNGAVCDFDYFRFDKLPKAVDGTISALDFDDSYQVVKNLDNIGGIKNGSWVAYRAMDFGMTAPAAITVSYSRDAASCKADGYINVILDDLSNTPVARIKLADTVSGSWDDYESLQEEIVGDVTGIHTIYLYFETEDDGYVANVKEFSFDKEKQATEEPGGNEEQGNTEPGGSEEQGNADDNQNGTETGNTSDNQNGTETGNTDDNQNGTETGNTSDNQNGTGTGNADDNQNGTGTGNAGDNQNGTGTGNAGDNQNGSGAGNVGDNQNGSGAGNAGDNQNGTGTGNTVDNQAGSGAGNTVDNQAGTGTGNTGNNENGTGNTVDNQTGSGAGNAGDNQNGTGAGSTVDNQNGTGTGNAVDNQNGSEAGNAGDNQNGTGTGNTVDNQNGTGTGNTVDNQTGSGAGNAVDNQTGSGAGNAVDNQTGSGAGNAVDNQTGTGAGSTVDNQTGSGAGNTVDNQTGTGTGNTIDNQTGSGAGNTVDNQNGNGTGNTVDNQNGNGTGNTVDNQNGSGAGNTVDNQTGTGAGSTVDNQTGTGAGNTVDNQNGNGTGNTVDNQGGNDPVNTGDGQINGGQQAATENQNNQPVVNGGNDGSFTPVDEGTVEPEQSEEVLRVGASFKYKNLYYKITKVTSDKVEVQVLKPAKKTYTSISIPATVKYGGKTCKVTSIAKNAFKNNKKLKKVTIGKNVVTIGNKAFYNCSKLSKVTFKKNKLKKVGASAFKNTATNLKIKTGNKALVKNYQRLLKNKIPKGTIIEK